jgi:hypothetical protein
MKKVFIYVLINPLNKQIFYVGYTNNPKKRLNEHISDKYNLNKDLIIDDILLNNKRPILNIIDECEYVYNEKFKMYEHERLEIYYIKKYKNEGIKLSNLTNGGGLSGRETIEIYRYDENGDFKKKYNSLTEASEDVHVSISKISLALNQKINKSSANCYWFTNLQSKENIKFRKAAKRNILILQYSLDGIFLNKFNGQGDAENKTGVKCKLINKCLRKDGYNQAGGYMWFYENKLPKEIKKYKNIKYKSIVKFDINDNLIEEYDSINKAIELNKYKSNSIYKCLNGKCKTSGGFKWKYKNN